jgi:chromosome segregation ATPase
MNRTVKSLTTMLLALALVGCASSKRVRQLEAELFVAQSQVKTLTDRMNSLEGATVGSTNNLAGRVEDLEKSDKTQARRLDLIEADAASLSSTVNAEAESNRKRATDMAAAKKLMDENLPQVTAFADANKKTQEEVARLQRDYGQKLRDVENKADALRSDVNALNGAYDRKTADFDKRIDEVRNDMIRRIDTANTDLLSLRNSTKDNVDDIKKALESMSAGIYEILRLQRQQFTNLRDEYDSSMSKIEPYLPKNTLGNVDSEKITKPEATIKGAGDKK